MSADYTIPGLDQILERGLRAAAAPGLLSAYLFGSHARGRPHRESDVDVGVLLDRDQYRDPAGRFDIQIRLATDLMAAVHRDVDVVILNDAPPLLGRRIITEGRRFFCPSPDADRDYAVYIQIRAADLAPWLRRYERMLLDTLRR